MPYKGDQAKQNKVEVIVFLIQACIDLHTESKVKLIKMDIVLKFELNSKMFLHVL